MGRPIEILTEAEVLAIIRASKHDCPTGRRNRAFVATLWRSGLRVSEALSLLPRDVNMATGRLNVRRGKGHKQRIVAIDQTTRSLINGWLEARQAGETDPLFCTLKGGPIGDSYIRRMLPRLAHRAGVYRRVHAHGFRHTFAVEFYGETRDVILVRRALGHSSIATTQNYLDHIDPHQVCDVMAERNYQVD